MTDSKVREIQEIISGVDAILRRKLDEAGIKADHDLAVLLPEGEVHTAELIAKIADGAPLKRPNDGLLN